MAEESGSMEVEIEEKIIFVPGFKGSKLVDAKTKQILWITGWEVLPFMIPNIALPDELPVPVQGFRCNKAPVVADAAAATPVAAPAPAPEPAPAADAKPKAVFVENLSPSVTSKTLNDFFSLCGPIESISIRPKPNAEDGTLEATVFFETSGAADTAVLLTNAILVDRTISITYFNGQTDDKSAAAKEGGAESAEKDAPSVWASLLAASYKFSDDVRARAVEVDTKYGVSKGFEDTVTKIDQTLGLTDKFNAVSTAVQQKSEELGVNQKMDAISASITQAGQSLEHAANVVLDSAMQNTYVSSAWTTLSGWGSSLISGWTQITQEADQIYPRQGKNPEPAAAAAAPAEGAAAAATADAAAAPSASEGAAAPSAAATDEDTVTVPSAAPQDEPKPAETAPKASADEIKIPSEPAN